MFSKCPSLRVEEICPFQHMCSESHCVECFRSCYLNRWFCKFWYISSCSPSPARSSSASSAAAPQTLASSAAGELAQTSPAASPPSLQCRLSIWNIHTFKSLPSFLQWSFLCNFCLLFCDVFLPLFNIEIFCTFLRVCLNLNKVLKLYVLPELKMFVVILSRWTSNKVFFVLKMGMMIFLFFWMMMASVCRHHKKLNYLWKGNDNNWKVSS